MKIASAPSVMTGRTVTACCCALAMCAASSSALSAQQDLERRAEQLPARSAGLFNHTDLFLGGLVVGSIVFVDQFQSIDQELSRELSRDVSERNTVIRTEGRVLGTLPVSLGVTLSTLAIGQFGGNDRLKRAGLHSLEALLVADAATQMLKIGIGRQRPSLGPNADNFRPFELDSDYHSFPSGHTSHVFAIAATMSSELKDDAPWLPYVLYPVATWTAVTRVQDRKHWVTDIVGGAALGVLSSRLVERLNHPGGRSRVEAPDVSWIVGPGPDGGLVAAVSLRFD